MKNLTSNKWSNVLTLTICILFTSLWFGTVAYAQIEFDMNTFKKMDRMHSKDASKNRTTIYISGVEGQKIYNVTLIKSPTQIEELTINKEKIGKDRFKEYEFMTRNILGIAEGLENDGELKTVSRKADIEPVQSAAYTFQNTANKGKTEVVSSTSETVEVIEKSANDNPLGYAFSETKNAEKNASTTPLTGQTEMKETVTIVKDNKVNQKHIEVRAIIRQEMIADGLIEQDTKVFDFMLAGVGLFFNGKKQSNIIFAKYKKIYEGHTGIILEGASYFQIAEQL